MIKTLVHLSLFLLLIALAGASYGQVPQIERDALIALYNSTDGANWIDNTGWLGEAGTECDWHGVNCVSGSVARLNYWRNGLVGTIPKELGDLSNLVYMHLGQNELSGTIPKEIGNLTKLSQMHLWGNKLSGSIPKEFGNLLSLTYLNISSNSLSGVIPSEMGNLANLGVFRFTQNSITGGLPAGMGSQSTSKISSVERSALIALYNSTDGANWTNNTGWLGSAGTECFWFGVTCDSGSVSSLSLNSNSLTGTIPNELGDLADLAILNLNGNSLSGSIPKEFGNLLSLTYLNISSNELSGVIPSEMGNLANLATFTFTQNSITGGLPAGMGSQSTSKISSVERSALIALYNSTDGANWTNNTGWLGSAGTECFWFGVTCDSGSVFSLSLMINSLTGTIPNELGDLADLAILNLNGNSLSGSIPTELGNLSNLEALNFYSNSLSGTIPSELGSLTKLRELSLGRNSLTGPIPIELGNLRNLLSIDFSYNSLSGTIPKELGNLTNLTNLYLGNNSLSGSIPSELGNLANLYWLSLNYNLLTGGIPKEIGNLINLSALSLRDNNLSGILPTELENLTKITYFDIWDGENSFSGTIPEVWEKLPKQRKFIHHNNHFVRDVDNDGIDDEIDSDLAASSPVKQITTPDYSISILGSGRVVNLVSNTTYKDKFKDLTSGTKPTQGDMQAITKILYAHFEDEFDYIMVNSGCVDKRKCISKAGTYGTHYSVKNDVKGIGREPIDLSAEFGSSGKLKGALYFPHMNGVTEGPSLHEIMHSWGNDFTTFDQYRGSAEPGDNAFTCPGHWGWSNVGGQLGGWKPHTLETLSDGSYQAKGPAVHWDYAKDNDPQYHFGSVAQGDNLAPYGKFELYLMGLIGADEVGHDIKIAQDFDWKDQAKGIFNATAIHTLPLEGIIAKEGPRVPSSKDSQKDFRAMYVIVSDEPLELNEWGYIDKQVYDFQLQGDDGNRDYNFWEATEGKATMTYDGAGDFLKTQATLKALVNPPAVSIAGGDRTIADSDKVTGESVNLTATASDSDGTIATTQWLVGGVEVAAGLSASVSLPNGSTVVTFKATDDDGASSTTTATITVEAPAYTPTEEWPAPYSGVTPDTSLGLAFNNIGIFNSSDATIYACLRLFTNGLASSSNGISQFDIGLKVVSLSDATVQITKSREFNTIGALNEKVQAPDCSGIFETTTGLYTDIIQANSSVLETVWSLIDSTKLILKLISSKELTAN